jgi:hypothetical protein
MASMPASELRRPIDNLLRHYDKIVGAIDMILVGF